MYASGSAAIRAAPSVGAVLSSEHAVVSEHANFSEMRIAAVEGQYVDEDRVPKQESKHCSAKRREDLWSGDLQHI